MLTPVESSSSAFKAQRSALRAQAFEFSSVAGIPDPLLVADPACQGVLMMDQLTPYVLRTAHGPQQAFSYLGGN
jgi:hypothetical protein